jgi:hypothetical protein
MIIKRLKPLERDDIYKNTRHVVGGKSREQRMGEIWDGLPATTRRRVLTVGGLEEITIGKGREYDPSLVWRNCGCSPKTAITNHCLRIFERKE